LTARRRILSLALVSSMPPLSLRCAEAVTYRIFKECRYCIFKPKFPEKATGILPVKTARLGISRFLRAEMWLSHRLYLLPLTAYYISELIILILKSSARQRGGYNRTKIRDSLHTILHSFFCAHFNRNYNYRNEKYFVQHLCRLLKLI
jgi:hypothetical protein